MDTHSNDAFYPSAREENRSRRSWRNPWIVAFTIILLAPFSILFFIPGSPVLGNILCDNPGMFYYLNHFVGASWRAGEVPLWNPYAMLGYPSLGEGQGAALHPQALLFVLLPTGVAINVLIVICFVASGFGFRGYLRAIGLGERAAFCGAICWCFSSIFISRIHAGHLTNILGFASLPYLLLGWEGFRRTGRIAFLALFAVAYALLVLASHPQFLYLFSLFVLVYVVVQTIVDCATGEKTSRAIKRVLILGVFVVLAVGMGAAQLIPSADFAQRSFRKEADFDFAASFSFPPENTVTLLCPYFFGRSNIPGPDYYWGGTNLWEALLYIGILPLLAAVAGVLRAPNRLRIPLLVCAGLFAIVGLGRHTPIFAFLYHHAPLYNVFRGAAKHFLITQFSLITLAAWGFEAWFASPDEKTGVCSRRMQIAPIVVAGLLLATLLALYLIMIPGYDEFTSTWRRFMIWRYAQGETYRPKMVDNNPEVLHATATGAALQMVRAAYLLVLSVFFLALLRIPRAQRFLFAFGFSILFLDLILFCQPLFATFDEAQALCPPRFLPYLKGEIYPLRVLEPFSADNTLCRNNIGMTSGFTTVGGYVGNTLPRYNNFVNRSQGTPFSYNQAWTHVGLLPPRPNFFAIDFWIKNAHDLASEDRVLVLEKDLDLALVDSPGPGPRVFLAESPKRLSSRAEALEYIYSKKVDPIRSPCIETTDPLPDPAPLDPSENARITLYRRNRVELAVHATHPRELILAEMHYKDWRAYVNGEQVAIAPGNYLFRAIRVPAGDSTVEFEYVSPAFRWGAAVSAGSILAFLSLLIALSILERRKRANTAPIGTETIQS